ncbi:MAG: hypothetical protein GTO14_07540 [Anaerolineales bacterium]|nr:hypothetical protein [Anaerolineales bacterium]
MAGKTERIQLDKKHLERWLAEALVPVEPSARFLRRLRARLVRYHGGRFFSGWMLLVVVATVIILFITVVRLFVRGISAWIGLIGGFGRKRREPVEPQSVSV